MSSPEPIYEHILSAEEQDELAHANREEIEHALAFIRENDPEFIETINRAGNRLTNANPVEKALFISGAVAMGALLLRRIWHDKIEEITGKDYGEEPDK